MEQLPGQCYHPYDPTEELSQAVLVINQTSHAGGLAARPASTPRSASEDSRTLQTLLLFHWYREVSFPVSNGGGQTEFTLLFTLHLSAGV